MLDNCVEVIELYHAAARTGLVVVPLSPFSAAAGSRTSSATRTPARSSPTLRWCPSSTAFAASSRAFPRIASSWSTASRPATARTASWRSARATSRRRRGDRPRRSVQHHLLVGDDRSAEGNRAHARDPRGLLHRLLGELPDPPGERRRPFRLARLQRRVPDADARVLSRLHVRAAPRLRRRADDRRDRARARDARHARPLADRGAARSGTTSASSAAGRSR